jgi:uncharacterized protein DUF4019
MSKPTAVVALLLLGAAAALSVADTPEAAAESAALTWLNLLDAGDYAQSWATASEYFRNGIPRSGWVTRISHTRDPLGPVKSRQLLSARYERALPAAPDGEYVVIQYSTRFEKKAVATETVTPMKEGDGHWRVSGYYIR